MVARAAISTYRRTAVETADAPRLILLAYEGAIQALLGAEERLAANDFQAKSALVIRAQEFISELLGGLNPEAGQVAENLRALYAFMLRSLVVIEPATEKERIAWVRRMMQELYSAWKTVIDGPGLGAGSRPEESVEAAP